MTPYRQMVGRARRVYACTPTRFDYRVHCRPSAFQLGIVEWRFAGNWNARREHFAACVEVRP